jgi:hypothetical protein
MPVAVPHTGRVGRCLRLLARVIIGALMPLSLPGFEYLSLLPNPFQGWVHAR